MSIINVSMYYGYFIICLNLFQTVFKYYSRYIHIMYKPMHISWIIITNILQMLIQVCQKYINRNHLYDTCLDVLMVCSRKKHPRKYNLVMILDYPGYITTYTL